MTMTEQMETIKKLIDEHCARSEYLKEEYFYTQLGNLCDKMSKVCAENLHRLQQEGDE